MAIFSEIFSSLLEVWKEMFGAFIKVFPKAIKLVFWVLTAFIVLPCVYIAGHIYPLWVEFGEDL